MQAFTWRDGVLHVDQIPLPEIAASAGTPTYVYSASAIRAGYRRLERAFAPLGARLHYAIKASPNLHLCRLLRGLGAGMDVVSGGEMERAWLAGTSMADIVFAGVGKTDTEIYAALDGRHSLIGNAASRFDQPDPRDRGPVGLFNVESESELEAISRIGQALGVRARACLRVNPDVDPHTHEYTTTGKVENKFGIDVDRIGPIFDRWRDDRGIELIGLHAHIGSPVPKIEPYAESIAVLVALIDDLEARDHRIEVLNIGGGWPVSYSEDEVPPLEDYAARVVPLLEPRARGGLRILLEPGRSILANAGILLVRIQHIKRGRAKTFAISDGGMHSLLRPALYRAFHFAWPVLWQGETPRRTETQALEGLERCDLVGPICETGDFLARDRDLPPLTRGDLIAVFSAGAYGISMASNYNDHGRPAEVLVDGDEAWQIRVREPLAELLETEAHSRPLALARGPAQDLAMADLRRRARA